MKLLTLTLLAFILTLFVMPSSALAGVVSSQTKFFTCEEKEAIAQDIFAVALDGKKLSPTTSTPEWALRMAQLANEYVGKGSELNDEDYMAVIELFGIAMTKECYYNRGL